MANAIGGEWEKGLIIWVLHNIAPFRNMWALLGAETRPDPKHRD